jgi:protein-L-isoaspartate(D-aspartate) O-methyltransferase
MHANAASALEEYATPGAKVLDVGCGSGYLTAVPSSLLEFLTVGIGSNGSTRG